MSNEAGNHFGWSVKHYYRWYRQRYGGKRSYSWVKNKLQEGGLVKKARGRIERFFRTHQERLPRELKLAGIRTMEEANRYLREVYLPAFNQEFRTPAAEQGTAFVPWTGEGLWDILCEQHERVVGNDNCVSFEGKGLQIPADWGGPHYLDQKQGWLRCDLSTGKNSSSSASHRRRPKGASGRGVGGRPKTCGFHVEPCG